MYHRLTLFLILLQVVYVLSGKNDQEQSTSNHPSDVPFSMENPPTSNQSSTVLPLIVIKVGPAVLNPTEVEHVFVGDTDVLSGATTFATYSSLPLSGSQLNMCPIENALDKDEKINTSTEFAKVADDYCVYPIKFEPNDPLRCPKEPEPFVSSLYHNLKGPDLLSLACGEKKRGKLYWFVYKTCITKKPIENEKILQFHFSSSKDNSIKQRTHFEVYKICYHEENKEVLYTKHRIMSPKLLNDSKLENERKTEYPIITDGYQTFGNNFETMQQLYSQLGDSSPYKIQNLVPSDDFAFALWRKTTYHYLNVKLMRKDLAKLWDYISDRIRENSIKHEKQYIISTGAFTLSENGGKVVIKDQLQAPDTWIKIIYDLDNNLRQDSSKINNEALAIIMVDNLDDAVIENFYKNSCKTNLCTGAFDNELYSGVSKFVKCCSLTSNIDKYFEFEDKMSMKYATLNPEFLFESGNQSHLLDKDIPESQLEE